MGHKIDPYNLVSIHKVKTDTKDFNIERPKKIFRVFFFFNLKDDKQKL